LGFTSAAIPSRSSSPVIGPRVRGNLALRDQGIQRGRHQDGKIERLAGIDLPLERRRCAERERKLMARAALEQRAELVQRRLQRAGGHDPKLGSRCMARLCEQRKQADARRRGDVANPHRFPPVVCTHYHPPAISTHLPKPAQRPGRLDLVRWANSVQDNLQRLRHATRRQSGHRRSCALRRNQDLRVPLPRGQPAELST
jgi:hypothetical protein